MNYAGSKGATDALTLAVKWYLTDLIHTLPSSGIGSDSRMNRLARNEIYFRRDVPLDELARGIESVTLTYTPPGLLAGAILSALAIAGCLLAVVFL